MAKLNLGEAMELAGKRVQGDQEIINAAPEHLRLMTVEQLRESANRAIQKSNTMFLNLDVNPRYSERVLVAMIDSAMAIWRTKIKVFEDNDPTIKAERAAEGFLYNLNYMIRDAEETLARFKKNFDENPAYAFQSTAAVQAAGNLEVATRAKAMLEKYSVDEVKAELTNSLRYSFRIDGSTCPMTNLVDRAKQVAAAKLVGLNG